jgi:acetylornithine deacetylase/succinyl-diaminopimelate desuccinylase-like protein
MTDDLTGEAAELLQTLIRNGCVNDGTAGSGHEERNADTLAAYLDGSGVDLQRYEPQPGRASLVARLEGSDPSAPSLLLMGHTDVVPVTASRWRHDPFGGELIDGEIWGRGAIDMLDVTATMAVALRRLARAGSRHRGTLIYLGVADEEAAGTCGARWLAGHVPDAVRAEYVLTELGGARLPPLGAGPPRRAVQVAEKSLFWCTLRYTGTPGHASLPYRADNALVKAAEAASRLAAGAPGPQMTSPWQQFVTSLGLAGDLAETLTDPAKVDALLPALDSGLARFVHACTHCTIAPTVLQAGVKANVIPEHAALTLDIRALPGWDEDKIRTMLAGILGDLWDDTAVEIFDGGASPPSPVSTPLWETLQRAADRLTPGTKTFHSCSRASPMGGSSAGWAPPPTGTSCSATESVSTRWSPCSTATTNASTSKHCAFPPSCGCMWPKTSCPDTKGSAGARPVPGPAAAIITAGGNQVRTGRPRRQRRGPPRFPAAETAITGPCCAPPPHPKPVPPAASPASDSGHLQGGIGPPPRQRQALLTCLTGQS